LNVPSRSEWVHQGAEVGWIKSCFLVFRRGVGVGSQNVTCYHTKCKNACWQASNLLQETQLEAWIFPNRCKWEWMAAFQVNQTSFLGVGGSLLGPNCHLPPIQMSKNMLTRHHPFPGNNHKLEWFFMETNKSEWIQFKWTKPCFLVLVGHFKPKLFCTIAPKSEKILAIEQWNILLAQIIFAFETKIALCKLKKHIQTKQIQKRSLFLNNKTHCFCTQFSHLNLKIHCLNQKHV
jgi:hypothetical protein